MHLQRIQVPDFRVLKNVDISFEKEFVPKVFPLGSQNGGGKSTLLQLIFVLLHCSVDPERVTFLRNILDGFKIYDDAEKRILAIIDIWDGEKIVQLEFFSYRDSYIEKLMSSSSKDEVSGYAYLTFSVSTKLEAVKNKILIAEKEISNLKKTINRLETFKKIENDEERRSRLRRELLELRESGLRIPVATTKASILTRTSLLTLEEIQEQVQETLEVSKLNAEKYYEERDNLEGALQKVTDYLQSKSLTYICNYSVNENEKNEEALLCKVSNIEINEVEVFLNKLSKKTFLAAPATQVFLFLDKESRKLLFRDRSNEKDDYYLQLKAAKSKIPGFFTYDFLAVDLLIEAFMAARDQDFRQAIETDEYGKNYKQLKNDLNQMLVNKNINIDKELSEVTFNSNRESEAIELYPEDLSHGELKRLTIYMWIKSRNIENAIVLMDEIEIAFHPDWQYQIISDLKQWSPNNQYILATHSYELCRAVTPSHVKELEPKLLKQEV
jgi:ABC-type dipeptide/oligopeptide/nickel transport system ATPase component